MNIAQLRASVNALLGASPNLIGLYTFPDNTQIPALYVVGRQGVPGEWKVKGLEVTIQEFPRLNPRPGVGTFQQRKEWAVVLVNYDAASSNLDEAARRISRKWPDARFSFTPETDNVYGQYRVVIPDVDIDFLIR